MDWIYYLMLLGADVLLALIFSCNKLYEKRAGQTAAASLFSSAVMGAFMVAIFFCVCGFAPVATPYSLLLSAASSLSCLLYGILCLRMLAGGQLALYTLFLMTGGMVVPWVWGVLFLGEWESAAHPWLRVIGLVLLIGGVVFSNIGKNRPSARLILMGVLVFFLNGCTSVLSKLHQNAMVAYRSGVPGAPATADSTSFVFFGGVWRLLFAASALALLALIARRKKKTADVPADEKPRGFFSFLPDYRAGVIAVFVILACASGMDGVSYYLQLEGAAHLPASVNYPFITGGSIVFSTLAGWLLFREKPSARLWLGTALCFAGTLFFL